MSPIKCCVALATLLAAGCASAPEEIAENGLAETALDGAQATQAAAIAMVRTDATPLVLELQDIDQAAASTVICREMLKQGSNVIVTQCRSREDWKRFKRLQMIEAQEMLRALQGSAFR